MSEQTPQHPENHEDARPAAQVDNSGPTEAIEAPVGEHATQQYPAADWAPPAPAYFNEHGSYGQPDYQTAPAPYGPAYYAQAPQYGQPQYGQAPQYGQPQYGQPQYGASTGTATAPAADAPAKGPRTGRTILIAAVVAALVGGGVGAGTVALMHDNASTPSAALSITSATGQNTAKIDGTVTAAAAKIQPSVVTINVAGSQASGTGSGVIVKSEGYILTNAHVVSVAGDKGSISVVTTDGQSAAAKVVGIDASDDLAVIKVDGLKNLTAATFAKSGEIKVGQSVVAVGAPLGLSDTVTSGIVSNTARPVRSGDNDQAVFEAVQTDAAINPGNSGGPLVDLNGNVIGINAAIATANSGGLSIPGQSVESGSIGIGFAIPSDEASRIADSLITTGKASHAVIGVTVQNDQSQSGSQSGTSATPTVGATIKDVTAGGPAGAAGMKSGDVVTAVDSQRIADADSLIAAVRSHAPGDTVTLTYTRNGTSGTAKVKLGTSSS